MQILGHGFLSDYFPTGVGSSINQAMKLEPQTAVSTLKFK